MERSRKRGAALGPPHSTARCVCSPGEVAHTHLSNHFCCRSSCFCTCGLSSPFIKRQTQPFSSQLLLIHNGIAALRHGPSLRRQNGSLTFFAVKANPKHTYQFLVSSMGLSKSHCMLCLPGRGSSSWPHSKRKVPRKSSCSQLLQSCAGHSTLKSRSAKANRFEARASDQQRSSCERSHLSLPDEQHPTAILIQHCKSQLHLLQDPTHPHKHTHCRHQGLF